MSGYSLLFLMLAAVAAVLGFGGIVTALAGLMKIVLVVCAVLFVITLLMPKGGRRPPPPPPNRGYGSTRAR